MAYFKKLKEKTSQEIKETPILPPTNAQDAIDEVKEELIADAKAEEKAKQDLIPTPPPVTPKKVKARAPTPKRKNLSNPEVIDRLKDSHSDHAKKVVERMFGNKSKSRKKSKTYRTANNNRYFTTVDWFITWLREEDVQL